MFSDSSLYFYLKNHDFGEPFDIKTISLLEVFCDYCDKNPDFVFINSDLELFRKELLSSVISFKGNLAHNSNISNAQTNRIPNPEYGDNVDVNNFLELRTLLNKLAGKVILNYDSIISRSILLL
jgi:hypothetical protein